MKRLKGKNKGKVITHSKDQQFEEKKMDLSSYSIGDLERLNHFYLTQEDFKDPHISHETVQKQLKQLYGSLHTFQNCFLILSCRQSRRLDRNLPQDIPTQRNPPKQYLVSFNM